ncbi:MAG: hypothetical protein K2J08_02350 [Ruminococcus sp.]|nr:hypothetical protein [Ruminococcus sp.]
MGFFDTLSGAINSASESSLDNWMRNYKQKLKNASDSQVQAKWDEVSNNYSIDEQIKEATKNEMRRRGLL